MQSVLAFGGYFIHVAGKSFNSLMSLEFFSGTEFFEFSKKDNWIHVMKGW